MDETNWWKTAFDQGYLDTYLADFTEERTSREIDFVIKAAKLTSKDKILDLACGHGRHSIELAKRGFNVTGLDYSEFFLKKARADAEKLGVETTFVHGDMRKLPFDEEFDVILTLFTTFGYFDDETNQKVLEEINKSLKPEGRFLIDVISGEAVFRRFNSEGVKEEGSNILKRSETRQMGKVIVNEIEWFDPKKQLIETLREWVDNGKKQQWKHYLRVYTIPQYRQMFSKAGFKIEEIWGDFQGNPHDTNGNFRTIILATKK